MIPSSVVAWRGPSQIDGGLVELVLTGLVFPSRNSKTGPMVQASIVVAGKKPLEVIKSPEVRSICGDCRLLKACYVGPYFLHSLGKAPKFEHVTLRRAAALLKGTRGLRCGAYGDPAAVPFDVWEELITGARFHTCYTHQWRVCDRRFRQISMASCETREEAVEARRAGWRTFRIRPVGDSTTMAREVVCRYEATGTTCLECKLCDGARGHDVVVTVHGTAQKRRQYDLAVSGERGHEADRRTA